MVMCGAPKSSRASPGLVGADQAGAGPGDQVLVVSGGGARVAAGAHVPVDAAIVGIVDHVER